MGQVLSCPQFIFRATPLTDGETEAREVRPPAAMAGTPSQGEPGQSRFLRILGAPVSKMPWNGAGLGDSGQRREDKKGWLAARAEGLTPGLVRGARSWTPRLIARTRVGVHLRRPKRIKNGLNHILVRACPQPC